MSNVSNSNEANSKEIKSNYEIKPLVGTAWDYSKKENWMFFDNNDDIDHEVDVFFFYPTSVSAEVKEDVCQEIKYMEHNAMRSYLQAADTLSSFANIYAPYYRQLSFNGIMKNMSADKFCNAISDNVTRTDAYAALDYYFENCNKGKPYILAGHSQGSATIKIVLSEYMKLHPEYLDRLVAVYPIGYYFSDSWFKENPQIKKATGETDTGVLITWNTEGPDCKKFNLPIGDNNDAFAINPLNWKTDETYADIALNKGSVFVDEETLEKTYKDGVADAKVDIKRGVIVTTTYKDFIPENEVFGEKSCHFEDWSLFTMNIRENAKKRIAAFLGHEAK